MHATSVARLARLALLPLALALLLALPATVARAADTATVAVDLNLRSGPGLDFDVLAIMPAGSVVELTGEVADAWSGVVFAGVPGWAFTGGLAADPTATPAPAVPAPTATVIAAALNVRAAPGLDAALVAVLDGGARVAIVGGPVEADEYTWVEIAAGAVRGWAAAEFLAGDDQP